MSVGAIVGAVVGLSIGVGYLLWVRQRLHGPLPQEPHAFAEGEAVRFLGTAKVADQVASWPRGEFIVDRSVILVRAARPGRATGDETPPEVLIARDEVRSVTVRGGRMSRRVSLQLVGRARKRVGEVTFGAALSDPAPVLRSLGWPVS